MEVRPARMARRHVWWMTKHPQAKAPQQACDSPVDCCGRYPRIDGVPAIIGQAPAGPLQGHHSYPRGMAAMRLRLWTQCFVDPLHKLIGESASFADVFRNIARMKDKRCLGIFPVMRGRPL